MHVCMYGPQARSDPVPRTIVLNFQCSIAFAAADAPRCTPATQDARPCRRVPRLPRKEPRRPRRPLGTKPATRASPVPEVPHLPPETKVDVTKSHACHAGCTSMSPSATPATQRAAASTAATPVTQSDGRCHQVPRLPRKVKVNVAKLCEQVVKLCVCVSKLCVRSCQVVFE